MSSDKAVSRAAAAVIAVVVIVAAVAAGYIILNAPRAPTITVATTPAATTPAVTTPAVKTPTVQKVRVAVMLPGSITDFGWNANMYQAALKLNSTDPNIEVVYAEGLGQAGPAVDATMRDFARRGFDIIVAWTIGYQDAVLRIAPDFPKTAFLGVAFWQFNNLPNALSVNDRFFETYYLEGMLAGALTKTGIVGWIDGQEFANNNAIVNAFYQGALRTNPNVKLRWAYAGVWDDINKGREIAKTLIDAGVDVLSTRGDGVTLGAIQAASIANIYVFGDMIDQRALAPKNMIASSIYNDYFILTEAVRLFREGKLIGPEKYPIVLTVANGGTSLSDINPAIADKIPASVKADLAKAISDIKSGALTIPRITEAPKQ